MDPFPQAVLEQIKAANNDLRNAVGSLSGAALDWRPLGEETSSLFILAVHTIGVQRSYVGRVVGRTVERDRSEEFRSHGDDITPIVAQLDQAEKDIEAWLGELTPEMLAAQHSMAGLELSGAGVLLYAVRHVSEHVGHVGMTRQLWDHQAAGA